MENKATELLPDELEKVTGGAYGDCVTDTWTCPNCGEVLEFHHLRFNKAETIDKHLQGHHQSIREQVERAEARGQVVGFRPSA